MLHYIEVCCIKVLEQDQSVNVIKTGLWFVNNGLLGTTLDGLINRNHIVEVKHYGHMEV